MCADSYKLSHPDQYPSWVTFVYSNFTPRRCRWQGMNKFVFFGLQAFLVKLTRTFQNDFFDLDEETAVREWKEQFTRFFAGVPPTDRDEARTRALWKLQYLPLRIQALPEGSMVNHNVPVFSICNTLPEFYWLTNFVESWMSADLWHPCTSATTSWHIRQTFNEYAVLTSDLDFMPAFQSHDFSFRGLEGLGAARGSGAAHILSSQGTDNCPALNWIDQYYPGSPTTELLATSVPATEHSVMCAGGEDDELETISRMLDLYPSGILSIVSDTWDFWKCVTEYYPALRDKILARDGKVVIRPDSSPKTPLEIICGDPEAPEGSPVWKGLVRCLHESFGATKNSKGYWELDPHIGIIYGDSITWELQCRILQKLMDMGYSTTNLVMGIGSFTYQNVTRDTHGIAIKATAVGRDWDYDQKGPKEVVAIFKDPKTDNSGKKSARGLLRVDQSVTGEYSLVQDCTWEELHDGCLELVWEDGLFVRTQSFSDVRRVLSEQPTN